MFTPPLYIAARKIESYDPKPVCEFNQSDFEFQMGEDDYEGESSIIFDDGTNVPNIHKKKLN
jgi:hypothetical protein